MDFMHRTELNVLVSMKGSTVDDLDRLGYALRQTIDCIKCRSAVFSIFPEFVRNLQCKVDEVLQKHRVEFEEVTGDAA